MADGSTVIAPALTVASFKKALAKVSSVSRRHTPAPILETVLVVSDGESISLTATDTNQEATASVDAPGTPVFEAAIWTRALVAFVSGLAGDLTIAPAADGYVRMACGNASANIATLPVADFPRLALPSVDKDGGKVKTETMSVSGSVLGAVLKAVSPAISYDRHRHYLNGAYLHLVEGVATVVATDGHRLFRQSMPDGLADKGFRGVIIHSDSVAWLRKHIGVGPVLIRRAGGFVSISGAGVRLIAKIIDGTYPPYTRVIPTEGLTHKLRPSVGFCDGVKWLARQSGEKTAAIKFALNGSVSATIRNFSFGTFDATLDGEYAGEGLNISINGHYVADALGAGLDPVLTFSDANSPILIEYTGSPGLTGVLMPLRV